MAGSSRSSRSTRPSSIVYRGKSDGRESNLSQSQSQALKFQITLQRNTQSTLSTYNIFAPYAPFYGWVHIHPVHDPRWLGIGNHIHRFTHQDAELSRTPAIEWRAIRRSLLSHHLHSQERTRPLTSTPRLVLTGFCSNLTYHPVRRLIPRSYLDTSLRPLRPRDRHPWKFLALLSLMPLVSLNWSVPVSLKSCPPVILPKDCASPLQPPINFRTQIFPALLSLAKVPLWKTCPDLRFTRVLQIRYQVILSISTPNLIDRKRRGDPNLYDEASHHG